MLEIRGLIEEIKEIMRIGSKQEKSARLAVVAFRFEMDQTLPVNKSVEAVSLLMEYAFAEEDQGLKDDLYNAIDDALFYQHIGKYIDWDSVVARLPLLRKNDLAWVLTFKGILVCMLSQVL